jgi:hypothetical protein
VRGPLAHHSRDQRNPRRDEPGVPRIRPLATPDATARALPRLRPRPTVAFCGAQAPSSRSGPPRAQIPRRAGNEGSSTPDAHRLTGLDDPCPPGSFRLVRRPVPASLPRLRSPRTAVARSSADDAGNTANAATRSASRSAYKSGSPLTPFVRRKKALRRGAGDLKSAIGTCPPPHPGRRGSLRFVRPVDGP